MPRAALAAIKVVIFTLASFSATAFAADTLPAEPQAAASRSAELVAANPNGASALIAVINYENIAGRAVHDRLVAFSRANPNIRFVVKPIAGTGPLSEFLAKAAYAAARQGKFAAFHEAAISAPQPNTYYSLRDSAPLIGLDWPRFQKDFQNTAIAEEVRANAKFAEEHKIAGAPAFVAGGQVFAAPWDKLDLSKIAAAAK
jgi:protein-disulfide isomerase